jgi:hypothetical protein
MNTHPPFIFMSLLRNYLAALGVTGATGAIGA